MSLVGDHNKKGDNKGDHLPWGVRRSSQSGHPMYAGVQYAGDGPPGLVRDDEIERRLQKPRVCSPGGTHANLLTIRVESRAL